MRKLPVHPILIMMSSNLLLEVCQCSSFSHWKNGQELICRKISQKESTPRIPDGVLSFGQLPIHIVLKRRRPDSNRWWRFCRPLPYHLATSPNKKADRFEDWQLPLFNQNLQSSTSNFLSGRWDSNPWPSPWQGDVIPLNYARKSAIFNRECREPESNWRHRNFQSRALPTELSRPI